MFFHFHRFSGSEGIWGCGSSVVSTVVSRILAVKLSSLMTIVYTLQSFQNKQCKAENDAGVLHVFIYVFIKMGVGMYRCCSEKAP